MDAFLNSRFAPELIRIALTGSVFFLGMVAGWLLGWRRRRRQLAEARQGVAREVLALEKVLIEARPDGVDVLRIRSCGRDPIDEVFPNAAARDAFLARAEESTPARPLISMEDQLGSYLLQELAIWVCGEVGERDFPHDLWVMVPVCERGTLYLGGHITSTVLLVRRRDLDLFGDWSRCRAIQVEHRSHGERILTLMRVAAEFERQQALVHARRDQGRPSKYEETMYLLDLGLDDCCFDLPTTPVPWERFEALLPPAAVPTSAG